MTDKLPAYFKDYLDERFDNVLAEVKLVKAEVQDLKVDVTDLKKKMMESAKDRMKLWIGLAVILIVLLVHFGETSESLLKMLFGRF